LRAQAAPLAIARRVSAKAVWFFFTDYPIEDLPFEAAISTVLLQSNIIYDPLALSSW
jgi:hypothetical protein